MKLKSIFFILFAVLLAALIILSLRNKDAMGSRDKRVSTRERDRQKFIFLLQYIGRDYQNAVEDGIVTNEFEYGEITAFCHRAIELYLTFGLDTKQNVTLFELQQLRQMVYEKEDRYSIGELTRKLIRDSAKQLDVRTFPAMTPDIERGRVMYEAGRCGVCHGISGAGDGEAAELLEPGPGSFREQANMNDATPYAFFNAIRLGVNGTAMPSYEDAFSRQQAWDVAFYLMTLRDSFEPRLTGGKPDLTLEDLATRSNLELLEDIKDQRQLVESKNQAQDASISTAIDFLRRHPSAIE